MPTRRGTALALGSTALLLVGRVFAIPDLFLVAAGGVALVAGAVAYVRLTRVDVEARRHLRPARVSAGASGVVHLSLRNTASALSPLLSLRDPFEGGRRSARFLAAPLGPGEAARAAYRLPTERRGIYRLGPLELRLGDPFGLAARRIEAAAAARFVVYPRIEPIDVLPPGRGDHHRGPEQATALAPGGEDLYALREYVIGDDLRRVHWKSTAKVGELMVRQPEATSQDRTTLLLDLRRGVHGGDTLERAVSAAASIVDACRRQGSSVRLLATDGTDLGPAAGDTATAGILEHLAGTGSHEGGRLQLPVAAVWRGTEPGALVVITTEAVSDADLAGLGRANPGLASVTVVILEDPAVRPDKASTAPHRRLGGMAAVRAGTDQSFAAAWTRALARVNSRA